MRVLLIAGGWSSEREISLSGARGIAEALRSLGHDVTFFDLLHHFDELLAISRQHDVALINLHGQPGEDGIVQAMLDRVGCPYQGTGPSGSFLALNKAVTKQILKDAGLPTPAWEFLPQRPSAGWEPRIAYPIFAKSNTGGSSLHLGKAMNKAELNVILDEIFAAGDVALIEEALFGREITCGVLGDDALPPIQIEPVKGGYQASFALMRIGNPEKLMEYGPAAVGELSGRLEGQGALYRLRSEGLGAGCSLLVWQEDTITLSENQMDLITAITENVYIDDGTGYLVLGSDNKI